MRPRVVLPFAVSLVLAAGAATVGCAAEPIPMPDPFFDESTPSTRLRPGADLLEPETSGAARVEDGRIVFPAGSCDAMKKYKAGSVIVGERGPAGSGNPEGFIRKVVGVRCDRDGTVVDTEPGAIGDAFDELTLDDLLDGELDVDCGRELFRVSDVATTADGRSVPFTARAALECSLSFDAKHKVKADFSFPKLKSLELGVTAKVTANLAITFGVDLDPAVDEKTRAELAGKLLTKTYVEDVSDEKIPLADVKVGIVTFPITAHYRTTLACDFAFTTPVEAKAGGSATGTMSAGITWDGTKLRPTFDKSLTLEPLPPTFTKDGVMRAQCTLTPRIETKLFGLATGEVRAEASGGVDAKGTCGAAVAEPPSVTRKVSGTAQARLGAFVKADLNLFGLKRWTKECTLFDVDGKASYERSYSVAGDTACAPVDPLPLPPLATPNPEACFADDEDASPVDPGTCTHDVCTAGDKLGRECDECTKKVCEADAYCCDTYWGLSCFDSVEKLCGKTCGEP